MSDVVKSVAEGIRGVVSDITGSANVAQEVKLKIAEIPIRLGELEIAYNKMIQEQIRANESVSADTSVWVRNLRQATRPIAFWLVLFSWVIGRWMGIEFGSILESAFFAIIGSWVGIKQVTDTIDNFVNQKFPKKTTSPNAPQSTIDHPKVKTTIKNNKIRSEIDDEYEPVVRIDA